jgi:hypothetical protein
MAIIEAKAKIGEGAISVSSSDEYQMTLTEEWEVKTDVTAGDWGAADPLFFVGDPLFPAIGAYHERNSYLQFKNFSSATQHTANFWTFSGMQFVTDFIEFNTDRYNPVDPNEAEKSWSFSTLQKVLYRAKVSDPTGQQKFERPVDEDKFPFSDDDEPVAIKETGEPIAGLTQNRYIPVCTYVRNEENPPSTLVTDPLVGTVNTEEMTIDGLTVPARTCLVQDVKVSVKKKSLAAIGTKEFRTITYTLAIDVEGWDIDLLQTGYYQIVERPPIKTPERIKISDGLDSDNKPKIPTPTTVAQLIDIDGKWINTDPSATGALANGDPRDNPFEPDWLKNVHYRVYRVHRYADISSLNFQ